MQAYLIPEVLIKQDNETIMPLAAWSKKTLKWNYGSHGECNIYLGKWRKEMMMKMANPGP